MNNTLDIKIARMHKLNGNSRIKAFADIKINDSILVKGLSVVDGNKGLFVSMPRQKGSDEKWYDAVRPLSKETRAEIQNAVLEEYNK